MLHRYIVVVLVALMLLCSVASAQRLATSELTNRSGSVANIGAVVVVDTVNASSFVKTTTESDGGVVGVVYRANIADDATGIVVTAGIVDVTCTGSVAIGDFLITSTTAGSAKSNGTTPIGSFAIALEAGTNTEISCFIYNGPAVLNASGDFVLDAHLNILDDQYIKAGTDNDIWYGYDEAGDNRAEWTDGTNLLMSLTDSGTTGRLFVTGDLGVNAATPSAQVEISKDAANATQTISAYHDTEATTPIITLRKADNTAAAPALVDDDAVLGTVSFHGYDGSGWHEGARIEARINGTPSDGTDLPTELTFWTVQNGTATAYQRLTIDHAGWYGFGTPTPEDFFEIEKDQNGATKMRVDNNTAGTAASSQIVVSADAAVGSLRVFSNSYTTSGQYVASSALFESQAATNGIGLSAAGATPVKFWTDGVERGSFSGVGLFTTVLDADIKGGDIDNSTGAIDIEDTLAVDSTTNKVAVAGSLVRTPVTITTDTTPTAVGRAFIIIGAWTAVNDITDFDNETAGQVLKILGGDTDCNVVDGAPIQLVGGTTWNGKAGATLELWSDGTIWYEASRSDAS